MLGFSGDSDLESAQNVGDLGSIPGSGRSPEGEHSNPVQYSCLENPMDRGTWRATAYRVAKSQTRLKQLSTHMHTIPETQWFYWKCADDIKEEFKEYAFCMN